VFSLKGPAGNKNPLPIPLEELKQAIEIS